MYICICKNVTDGQIRKAVREKGVHNLRGLRKELGACDQCGKCAPEARQIIKDCLHHSVHLETHPVSTALAAMAGPLTERAAVAGNW
jgi:bacterioferritin-associated ferredoxin